MADKRQLRIEIKERLQRMTEVEKKKMSDTIFDKVLSCDEFKNAKSVFCYMSVFNEPYSIDFIKKAIRLGKKVYVPQTDEDTMTAVEIDEDTEFWFNKYGILEPKCGQSSENKFLSKVKTYKCGVAFECQRIDVPFAEISDVPLDRVITNESN